MTKDYKVETLGDGAYTVTGDLESYYKDKERQMKEGLDQFWGGDDYSYMSVDLAVSGCEKLWTGLEKNYYGHKLWPIMYDTRNGVGKLIAEKSGKLPFVVMLQVWKGMKNVLFGVTQAEIDDAGFNWRKENLLADDDLLNRGISALRLKEHPMITTLIMDQYMHKRSKEQGVDAATLYRVWD